MDEIRPDIDAQAVATWLGLPRLRVYEEARTGRIPSVRIGKTLRFEPAAIRAWIRAGGSSANGGRDGE